MAVLKRFLLFLPISLVLSQTTGSDLLSVLRANELTGFATFLTQEGSGLLTQLNNREENDVTLFAPPGDAPNPAGISRRQVITQNQALLASLACSPPRGGRRPSAQSVPPPPPANETELQRRQLPPQGDIDPTNYELRETFLDSPDYVNLGPNQPLNWVSNYFAPDNGTGIAQIQFTSGNNTLVRTTGGPLKYNKGIIYIIDSWPSLPISFSQTLETAGHSDALEAIRAAGLEAKLNDTPKITVFVFVNGPNASPIGAAGLIVEDTLGYSTELENGQTLTASDGTTLTIQKSSRGIFVNGYQVVNPNVPIKNGVLHYIANDAPVSAANKPLAADGVKVLIALAAVGATSMLLL